MKKFLLFLLILIFLFFLYCLFVKKGGCCIGGYGKNDSTVKHWISWNVLFTPSSLSTSTTVIQDFENYLNNYVVSRNPSAHLNFQLQYCPCDSLLTNIDATLVYGSGNSIPPPPTKPNPGPQGDYTLGNNLNTYIPAYLDSNKFDTANAIPNNNYPIHVIFGQVKGDSLKRKNNVLAVIDTGLDTLTFQKSYPLTVWAGNLLWQDSPPNQTIFDVVLTESTSDLRDGLPGATVSNSVKHGTAATEIVLTQIFNRNPKRIPQIMSIRAFDDSEKGSIYTVSCALSYAIKHKADYINASWGYFGQEDSVLKKYVGKASDSGIRIIAAAGNTPGKHDPNKICNTFLNFPNVTNNLDLIWKTDTILFYPACFAPIYKNLVSVTQLDQFNQATPNDLLPCYYQNYSSNYITLGAFETPFSPSTNPCCSFKIPFLAWAIEGSSFATPAMTAKFMADMNDDADIKSWIRTHASHTTSNMYTDAGNYFPFNHLQ